jgi:hypothetical protein
MGSSSTSGERSRLAGLYTAVYNSQLYQHGTASTSGAKGKVAATGALQALLCEHKDLRALYEPVFALLNLPEGAPGRPLCAGRGFPG